MTRIRGEARALPLREAVARGTTPTRAAPGVGETITGLLPVPGPTFRGTSLNLVAEGMRR
jgi:hypothetical protein